MKKIICIDAGHGGEASGATYEYDGRQIYEKDLNLSIALKLEKELQKYKNVEIIQTRREDISVELIDRIRIAKDHKADYLISLHNNAAPKGDPKPNGCIVLVTGTHYQPKETRVPDIYESSSQLGLSIIEKLKKLGISVPKNFGDPPGNGLYRRKYTPENGTNKTLFYPDGSICDYYFLVRNGVESGIPSIIIEHAFLSNENDYRSYLSTEEKLEKLAKADADGIAEALSLTEK